MFTLSDVVPWGRSTDEYRRMFALSDEDLRRRILGCADGPASFNAEISASGGHVVSCDPLYRFCAVEIRQRIDETFQKVIEQTRDNADEFVWSERISDVAALGRIRMKAMQQFLVDYKHGKAKGRYVVAELPALPFEDQSFEIAVCSHFLFLYSEQFSEDFHVQSIRELCRVSQDVRLFPLLELGSNPSRHVAPVVSRLKAEGYHVEIKSVEYEFQRGGNQMLRVRQEG